MAVSGHGIAATISDYLNGMRTLAAIAPFITTDEREPLQRYIDSLERELITNERAMVNLANGGLIPHEYHVKCRDCRYGKHAGQGRVTADTLATKHALMKPGHTVEIRDHEIVIGIRFNERPTLDGVCPF